jgi:TatD DNase family protein
MATWPPFDLHAHVAADVDPKELLALRAVIFAATRSLDEARVALDRSPDLLTIWGVGVHPGVRAALTSFDRTAFEALVTRAAYVSEIGLDGKASSGIEPQREVLRELLAVVQQSPRITALHSFAATGLLLDELERTPIRGPVLHWWLGDRAATLRALDLGAYFTVNPASVMRPELLECIPLNRVLPETDHPSGDRRSPVPRRPGALSSVEIGLARQHGLSPDEMRLALWRNLNRLVTDLGCVALLPPRVQGILQALPPELTSAQVRP